MARSRFIRSLLPAAVAGLAFAGLNAQGPPDLEAQHQRLLPLFELEGVVFTDADETRGRLVVGVVNRGLEQSVRARLAALGVSSASVDVVQTPPIVPVTTLRDKVRPVVGGLQIRFSRFLCSLGFPALRNDVRGYVTAAHCSDKQGEVDGTLYYQPLNRTADELIGREIVDPPFFRNSGVCPKGKKCRYSDANFSDGEDTVAFTIGAIAGTDGPNNGSLELTGGFTISAEGLGEGAAVAGQTANKVGRSTGWTQGTVTRTCVHTGVTGTNILLFCQDFVEADVVIVAAGDSGSPVFRIDGPTVTLLGALWGGSTAGTLFVYSPIANVEQELGVLSTCDAVHGGC